MSIPSSEFVNTMIKAGAGAGKTYGLIHKIVDLVREFSRLHTNEQPRFVVTTFTRKATQEVRERLLTKALDLRKTDPEFGELFLRFLKSSGNLSISTIHGILNQFLRQYGNLIGLDPEFNITADSTPILTNLLHQLLADEPNMPVLVRKLGWRRLKSFFFEYHRNAILNPDLSPLPIVFFENHWKEQIKTLQLATTDLLPYIETLVLKSKSASLKNFHNGLNEVDSILRSHTDPWTILEKLKVAKELFPRSMGALANWDESAKSLRTNILDLLATISEDPWTIKSQAERHHEEELLLSEIGQRFSHRWLQRKIELAELELEDLELLSLYILRRFPDATQTFTDSWDYWFIDEYQDTSPIQVEILNRLIGKCPHYVVGDPQQSIYFFRGARSKVFQEKLEHFANSGARIEEKKVNRRSQTPTLHFINDLMDLVNKHQFSSMESLSENDTKNLSAGYFYLVPEDEDVHLDGVVRVVEGLLQSHEPSSIAILCRENYELRRLFLSLQKANLPVQLASQGRFLEDRAIRDALNLWRFLVNPFDDINLIELVRSESFNIPDSVLFSASATKSHALWPELKRHETPSLQKLRQGLEMLSSLGHVEAWLRLLVDSPILANCNADDPSGRREGNLWKLIAHITEQSRKGSLNYIDPMELQLKTESNNENEAQSIRNSNQIQLMTIHASKGLEFDHVLLPFLNHNRKKDGAEFWSIDLEGKHWSLSFVETESQSLKSSSFAKAIANEVHALLGEESERLFYVAVTRSKKSIHFFLPQDLEKFSADGWAQHLVPFIAKGSGQFHSDNDSYIFNVLPITEVEHCPFNKKTHREKSHHLSLPPAQALAGVEQSSISITQLVAKQTTESKNLSWPTRQSMERLAKGIRIHRYLDGLAYSGTTHQSKESWLRELFQDFKPLAEVIQSGTSEWPFSIKAKSSRIDGQIDLWGRDSQNNLWIIDYKTGSPAHSDLAFRQMKLYAWALYQSQHVKENESIHLAVCYIGPNSRTLIQTLSFNDLKEFAF